MGLNTIMSPRFGAVASYTIRFTSVTSPLLRMGLMESPPQPPSARNTTQRQRQTDKRRRSCRPHCHRFQHLDPKCISSSASSSSEFQSSHKSFPVRLPCLYSIKGTRYSMYLSLPLCFLILLILLPWLLFLRGLLSSSVLHVLLYLCVQLQPSLR